MATPVRGAAIDIYNIRANFSGGNLDAGWNPAYNVNMLNMAWYRGRYYYSGYYGNLYFPSTGALDIYTYFTAASGNCNCCCQCCCATGTGCCFDPNARVLMKDGGWKKISKIKVGDEVVGLNGTVNRVTGMKSTTVGSRKMIKFIDYNFYSTDDHLFLTVNGWKTWRPDRLVDNILQKVDRASMTVSLEGREPFLDHRIIEWAAQLPDDYKYYKGSKKHIIKEIVHQYIPKQLMDRPKMGFAIPIENWLINDLKDKVHYYLDDKKINQQGVFNIEFIHIIKSDFYSGKKELALKLWYALMFQMWYEKWMN